VAKAPEAHDHFQPPPTGDTNVPPSDVVAPTEQENA
jgi:hypothetical protein